MDLEPLLRQLDRSVEQYLDKPGQNFYKILAESALRAVRMCTPLKVPSSGYEKWKVLQLNFDVKKMLGG